MARMIYRCRSKMCGKVWAYDYPESEKVSLGYGRSETRYFRIEPTYGRKVNMGYDSTCPGCEGRRVKTARVVGHTSDHKCDDRCIAAIGPNCECSCGGKNHGVNYLVA